MIPYLAAPSFKLGPITIHVFGLIVALAVWTGVTLVQPRYLRAGLDGAVGERLNIWMGVVAVLCAHLFSVLFYFPNKLQADPLLLLRVWEDISSFGGITGGLIGTALFLWIRNPTMPSLTRWKYIDTLASVFPFALAVGRVACTFAHDHPGTITNFPLAISLRSAEAQEFIAGVYSNAGRSAELPPTAVLATMGFHDLGWYELLYLILVVFPVIIFMYKRARRPGSMLLAFGLTYLPMRIAFDFIRVSDKRYSGLTPGQWVAGIALFLLPLLYLRVKSNPVVPAPANK
ncbi:MAG: prolipoprotein diacylglyceryl transferase family protein [Gemmatimonas sp.]